MKKTISTGKQTDFAKRLDLYIKSGFTFTMELSNYTQTLIHGEYKHTYTLSEMNARTFALYNRVKADILNSGLAAAFMQDVEPSKVRYYGVRYGIVPQRCSKVFSIDLNSAYATILKNSNIITQETLTALNSAPKEARLQAVGMLAACKNIHYYQNGFLEDIEIKESEFSKIFFYCAQKTYYIMDEIKNWCVSDWLFTWVDGIYFKANKELKENPAKYIEQINKRYNIGAKIEPCKDFSLTRSKDLINLDFQKFSARKRRWERKTYSFPDPNMIINLKKIYSEI